MAELREKVAEFPRGCVVLWLLFIPLWIVMAALHGATIELAKLLRYSVPDAIRYILTGR